MNTPFDHPCPRCGQTAILRGTHAGVRYYLCPACSHSFGRRKRAARPRARRSLSLSPQAT